MFGTVWAGRTEGVGTEAGNTRFDMKEKGHRSGESVSYSPADVET